MNPVERPLLVACLCAQWCGVCRDYEPVFAQAAQAFEARADFIWVDIEDHDETLGNIDVETFPTVLIARADEVLFFGAVAPHGSTLARIVESASAGELTPPVVEQPVEGLAARVRALPKIAVERRAGR
ncbi:MAG: thioredoxin domain-containing protein [Caldimonas sp.]